MVMFTAAAMAGAALGVCSYHGGGPWPDDGRPIATRAPYPAGMVDDVHRPGFNGRLWITRPIIGGVQGPYAVAEDQPGASYYGAFDRQNAEVYVRVVHTVIGINAWDSIDKRGLQHLERARQFWLREQGYTGGVRTFVNDAAAWAPTERPSEHVSVPAAPAPTVTAPPAGPIQPRATIRLPDGTPKKSRIRVQSAPTGATIAALPGNGPARVSWPQGAPADGVIRSAAEAGVQTVAARAE